MASKRAAIEFVNDDPIESIDWFDGTVVETLQNIYDEEVESERRVEQKRKQIEVLREKAYNAKISAQLEGCGKVLENKLKWADNFWMPEPAEPKPAVTPPTPPRVAPKPPKRFGKFRPLDVSVKVGSSSNIELYREPEPVVAKRGTCRYITAGKECPFGNRCCFSHECAPATTAAGNSKKIWMCRNAANGCRFSQCGYAHTVGEVRAAVRSCSLNSCNRVKKVTGRYVNSLSGDARPCMRLHAGEAVENFIQRTSKL